MLSCKFSKAEELRAEAVSCDSLYEVIESVLNHGMQRIML